MKKEEQRKEIREILKDFHVDVIIRRGENSRTVVIETQPLIWVSSVQPLQEKTVRIWHSLPDSKREISRALKEMRGKTIKKKRVTQISYNQLRKLVDRFLMEMSTKTRGNVIFPD